MISPPLHGWIRLCIVFSVAWLIGVSVYAVYKYSFDLEQWTTFKNNERAEDIAEGWDVVQTESFFNICKVDNKNIPICTPRSDKLSLLAFLPLVSTWLSGFLLVVSFLWVRAGFRKKL